MQKAVHSTKTITHKKSNYRYVMAFILSQGSFLGGVFLFKEPLKDFFFPEIKTLTVKIQTLENSLSDMKNNLEKTMNLRMNDLSLDQRHIKDELHALLSYFNVIKVQSSLPFTPLLKIEEKIVKGEIFFDELSKLHPSKKVLQLIPLSQSPTKILPQLTYELGIIVNKIPTSWDHVKDRLKTLVQEKSEIDLLKQGKLQEAIEIIKKWKIPPKVWLEEAQRRLKIDQLFHAIKFESLTRDKPTDQFAYQPTYKSSPL